MEKLKIGLIGCGGMMGYHVMGISKFDDVEIVAVADPVVDRTESMMKTTGATRAYPSHNEFFAKEDKLDAVYICVEPTAHDQIEETCIKRDLPFFVEKPMTLDMAQAKAISDAVAAKNLVTCVGFQDRYLDVVDRVKEELRDMQVGMVYGSWMGGVPGVWWWMRKATCGGQLFEQNIHLVDLLRYFFGEAEKVYATSGRGLISADEFSNELPAYDTDDFSTAVFTFKNGVVANLMTGCFIRKGNAIRNGMTIVGRDKSLEYDLRSSLTVYTPGMETKMSVGVNQVELIDRAFLNAVREKDPTAVRSPYTDGYKTLLLANAANESMACGQAIKL